ncbi:MAG: gliding motility-associated ABC transporter ATP-binding subunit GldA [Bacteroidia bacterium]|nr:gliding motility-associated ABC transporter ATP-binding subunit GldA [Bacteroidia bacterium]
MSVIVKNVTKLYNKQKALDDVSFEIASGQIAGFIGPNGAGKSTMMKIITGFIPATSGEVFINGLDIDIHKINISCDIGYLPENNPLYTDMYIVEYLEYVAGLYKLKKRIKKRLKEIVEQTGLTPEIKKKIGALSKGFRQRVGLAQVLLHDPKVLILDEPTSGLDPNQIIEIRNLISEIGKKKTVMLSTHIMQEVEAICDRVIIINNGRIIANETKSDIHKSIADENQTVIVEFSNIIRKEEIESIPGVNRVVFIKANNWLIQSNTNDDIRPKIFQFVVNHNLTVLSMQRREKSIEEVFHELTK